MLVFAFRSESWIVQNFNFTVFEDFCLSLSWKYRFLQNVNHANVQSKTNKYCKFHVDLTRRRLSKRRFKKLGMVPKKLYRNTLITWLTIYLVLFGLWLSSYCICWFLTECCLRNELCVRLNVEARIRTPMQSAH